MDGLLYVIDRLGRELGAAHEQIASLRQELAEVEGERDEAGRKIVELTQDQPAR